MNYELKIASIFSKLFEPALLLAATFLVGAIRAGVSPFWSCVWLGLFVVPTISYRLWAKYARGLDWDIKDRKLRIKPIAALLVFLGVGGLLISRFEPRLLPLCILFFEWVLGFLVITSVWTKISGHTGGDALATGLMVYWFGPYWWPVLLIVPLVGWARVVRKDHTPLQVIIGAMYSWGFLQLVTLV